MKKYKIISIILVMLFIATACTKEAVTGDRSEFTNFAMETNKHRKNVFSKDKNIKDEYINWFKSGEETFTEEERNFVLEKQKLYNNGNGLSYDFELYDEKKVLSKEEAKEDVEFLFKLFKYCYASYGYFGGDKKFDPVKQNIIKELDKNEKIKSYDFNNMLRENLSFIEDSHFIMTSNEDYEDGSETAKFYYMSQIEFYKKDGKYYKIDGNKESYILEIDGDKDIERYMKQTINKDGKLIYTVAMLKKGMKDNKKKISIRYSDSGDVINEEIKLSLLPLYTQTSTTPFQYNIENNIPIAKLVMMFDTSESLGNQAQFKEFAKEMREYSVSILDLRGNIGGDIKNGLKWIENFSGSTVEFEGAYSYADGNLVKAIQSEVLKIKSDVDAFDNIQRQPKIQDRIGNDKLVFVLIDKSIVSAGELFVEALMNMDNVILVGTNTMGSTLSNDLYKYKLKNSNMYVYLGNKLYISPYNKENLELAGFEPDILVDSGDALESILRLIGYYKLNE